MDSNLIISPSGEPQRNARPVIPLCIQYYPASNEVCAREVDLVLSVLDDIVQEMQRLEAEVQSDACIQQSVQSLPIPIIREERHASRLIRPRQYRAAS